MNAIHAVTLALGLVTPLASLAADHEVQMLNKGDDGGRMVFEPLVVNANPGDTITFVATDKSHNSASMKDGIPKDAEDWKGKPNEEITVTVSEPGVYMYECTPHKSMGMIGAIVVGEPINLDAVKKVKYPGKAASTAEDIFAVIEAGS